MRMPIEPRSDQPTILSASTQVTHDPRHVTVLIHAAAAGDAKASSDLLPIVYDELRRLAQANMGREARQGAGHTLQPTALVHEAYMRLVGDNDPSVASWQSRAHFFGAAALAMRRILMTPPASGSEAARQHGLRFVKALAGPGFEHPEGSQQKLVDDSNKRSVRPMGAYRQMLAVMADRGRANLLEKISAPTLVMHGKADPLLPYACGEDIAKRIPNAKLMGIDGMGHDFPPGAVSLMMNRLLPFLNAHTPA
jgi:pimeloyl-ACP methyl ester carboxylesterase